MKVHSTTNPQTTSPGAETLVAGICGGIAAYKTVEVVSHLRQQGFEVHVTMSESACAFVTPLTFAAISGQRVWTRVFPQPGQDAGEQLYPHLYPATRAAAFLLMPATAHMMGRIAQGLGDEPVSLTALSLPITCARFFCPAMNVEMWEQSAVQANVRCLEDRGWIRLGPASGALACGMEGAGRMMEPTEIVSAVQHHMQQRHHWSGKRVLILSGPTREYLDPVRFIGNDSSGRMGQALAEAAADRGANVTFVSGPVHDAFWPRRDAIQRLPVVSADEMLAAASGPFKDADIVIFAAAVADYKPRHTAVEKREKQAQDWALNLEATPDIAATLTAQRRPGQKVIGFALQSGDGREAAKAKLQRKRLDAIVLNHPAAMGADDGTFTFIRPDTPDQVWGALSKRSCATRILDAIDQLPASPHTRKEESP